MKTNGNGEIVIKKGMLVFVVLIITILTSFTSVVVQAATMQADMSVIELKVEDLKEEVKIMDTEVETCEQNMIKCGMDIKHIKETLDRIEKKIDLMNK